MKNIFNDFVSLFYPKYCCLCGCILVKNESCVCVQCLLALPKTNYHFQADNPLFLLFQGKVYIQMVTAFYFFKKGNRTQKLIHQLKYHGNKEIGFYFGFLLGLDLLNNEIFKSVDVLIPIPLHPNKYKNRGYNQSEEIAKGVAAAMQKAMDITSLIRFIETETQTKKSFYHRWQNTNEIFKVTCSQRLDSKHVLLIDDVITTGSTLESAANTLLHAAKNVKISIACLSYATI